MEVAGWRMKGVVLKVEGVGWREEGDLGLGSVSFIHVVKPVRVHQGVRCGVTALIALLVTGVGLPWQVHPSSKAEIRNPKPGTRNQKPESRDPRPVASRGSLIPSGPVVIINTRAQ